MKNTKWVCGVTFVADFLDNKRVLFLLGMRGKRWITLRREEKGGCAEREKGKSGVQAAIEGRETKTARVESEVSEKVRIHGCVPNKVLVLDCSSMNVVQTRKMLVCGLGSFVAVAPSSLAAHVEITICIFIILLPLLNYNYDWV